MVSGERKEEALRMLSTPELPCNNPSPLEAALTCHDSLTTVVRILAHELSTINVILLSVEPAALRSCTYALDQRRGDRKFAMLKPLPCVISSTSQLQIK